MSFGGQRLHDFNDYQGEIQQLRDGLPARQVNIACLISELVTRTAQNEKRFAGTFIYSSQCVDYLSMSIGVASYIHVTLDNQFIAGSQKRRVIGAVYRRAARSLIRGRGHRHGQFEIICRRDSVKSTGRSRNHSVSSSKRSLSLTPSILLALPRPYLLCSLPKRVFSPLFWDSQSPLPAGYTPNQ